MNNSTMKLIFRKLSIVYLHAGKLREKKNDMYALKIGTTCINQHVNPKQTAYKQFQGSAVLSKGIL